MNPKKKKHCFWFGSVIETHTHTHIVRGRELPCPGEVGEKLRSYLRVIKGTDPPRKQFLQILLISKTYQKKLTATRGSKPSPLLPSPGEWPQFPTSCSTQKPDFIFDSQISHTINNQVLVPLLFPKNLSILHYWNYLRTASFNFSLTLKPTDFF